MNLAKMFKDGTITVPKEIRQQLQLKPGDKLIFMTNADGEMVIHNASLASFQSKTKP